MMPSHLERSPAFHAAIEKTLEDCAARHSENSDTQEDGQDYRCYKEKAVHSPTRDEVLE